MNEVLSRPTDPSCEVSPLPRWIAAGRPQSPEETGFLAGAALAHLHAAMATPELPLRLLRDRLALHAAQTVLRMRGSHEPLPSLRDAVHLLGPRDQPDPIGRVVLIWRRAVARPLSHIDTLLFESVGDWTRLALRPGQGGAVTRAATVMEKVLDAEPYAELDALILADAALSYAIGWDRLTPLLAVGLSASDLRLRGADLQRACEAALLRQAAEAVQLCAGVARGAARLRAIAPSLRAKRSGLAVALFLSHDALVPRDLTALMSDRAARRLCERLVELGAVRELTGRDSFRLYGV